MRVFVLTAVLIVIVGIMTFLIIGPLWQAVSNHNNGMICPTPHLRWDAEKRTYECEKK